MKNFKSYLNSTVLSFVFILVFSANVFAQGQTVTGRVTDDKNEPLPGVTLLIKGTTTGTVTDLNGNYKLNVPDNNVILVFRFVGFLTKEIGIGNKTVIDISLSPSAVDLDEVVVIGYGTSKKRDMTGSVSSVRVQEMKATHMTSIEQGLQGRIAGVQITQSEASPDGGLSMVIRGSNSLIGGTEPLYIINGVPVSGGNRQVKGPQDDFGPAGDKQNISEGPNMLSFLNPDDIESIEILKDASSTAIYGSRGSNGVVIINTKKGKTGKATVNFTASTSLSSPIRKWDVLTGPEYAEYRNLVQLVNDYGKAFNFTTGVPGKYYEDIRQPYDGTYNDNGTYRPSPDDYSNGVAAWTDWQKSILRTSVSKKYALNVAGGSENLKYFVGASYDDIEGAIINSGYKRFSFNSSLDGKISDKLTLSNSLIGVRSFATRTQAGTLHGGANAGVITKAYRQSPLTFLGSIFYDELEGNLMGSDDPYTTATSLDDYRTDYNVMDNLALDLEVIKDLHIKVSGAVRYVNETRDIYWPKTTLRGYNAGNGYAFYGNNESLNWTNENIATYRFKQKKHSFDFMAGFTQEGNTYRNRSNAVYNFLNDITGFYNMSAAQSYLKPGSDYSTSFLESFLGRINYNYADKYLFTASLRADGCSKFGTDNKWGYFPSGAFAWRINQEEFLKGIRAISNLKLRLSYGVTGNSGISPYQSLSQLSTTNYPFANSVQTGYQNAILENPDLRWEKTSQYNIGMDLGLWNEKVSVTADYYIKKTDDLLQTVNLSPSSGWYSWLTNLGSLENRGIEFLIKGVIVDKQFKWDVTGTWYKNVIKVTDLGGLSEYQGGYTLWWNWRPFTIKVGEPLGVVYGYQVSKVMKTPADVADAAKDNPSKRIGELDFVKDEKGNSKVMPIGNTNPDFSFGLSSHMSFKSFDLSMLFSGSIGQDIFNLQSRLTLQGSGGQTTYDYYKRFWVMDILSKDGSVKIPDNGGDLHAMATLGGRQGLNNAPNNLMIEDGSFVKLRTVTLGYTLLSKYRPTWLKGLKPYISVNNVFCIDNYSGVDPEASVYGQDPTRRGVAYGEYPLARTWTFGLNATF